MHLLKRSYTFRLYLFWLLFSCNKNFKKDVILTRGKDIFYIRNEVFTENYRKKQFFLNRYIEKSTGKEYIAYNLKFNPETKIKEIDMALGAYYNEKNKKYYDSNQQGKFAGFCALNNMNFEQVSKSILEPSLSSIDITNFDKNFPYEQKHNDEKSKKGEIIKKLFFFFYLDIGSKIIANEVFSDLDNLDSMLNNILVNQALGRYYIENDKNNYYKNKKGILLDWCIKKNISNISDVMQPGSSFFDSLTKSLYKDFPYQYAHESNQDKNNEIKQKITEAIIGGYIFFDKAFEKYNKKLQNKKWPLLINPEILKHYKGLDKNLQRQRLDKYSSSYYKLLVGTVPLLDGKGDITTILRVEDKKPHIVAIDFTSIIDNINAYIIGKCKMNNPATLVNMGGEKIPISLCETKIEELIKKFTQGINENDILIGLNNKELAAIGRNKCVQRFIRTPPIAPEQTLFALTKRELTNNFGFKHFVEYTEYDQNHVSHKDEKSSKNFKFDRVHLGLGNNSLGVYWLCENFIKQIKNKAKSIIIRKANESKLPEKIVEMYTEGDFYTAYSSENNRKFLLGNFISLIICKNYLENCKKKDILFIISRKTNYNEQKDYKKYIISKVQTNNIENINIIFYPSQNKTSISKNLNIHILEYPYLNYEEYLCHMYYSKPLTLVAGYQSTLEALSLNKYPICSFRSSLRKFISNTYFWIYNFKIQELLPDINNSYFNLKEIAKELSNIKSSVFISKYKQLRKEKDITKIHVNKNMNMENWKQLIDNNEIINYLSTNEYDSDGIKNDLLDPQESYLLKLINEHNGLSQYEFRSKLLSYQKCDLKFYETIKEAIEANTKYLKDDINEVKKNIYKVTIKDYNQKNSKHFQYHMRKHFSRSTGLMFYVMIRKELEKVLDW